MRIYVSIIGGVTLSADLEPHLASDMRRSRDTEMCKTNKKKRPLQRKDGDSCRETVCKSNDALFLDLTQRNLLSYSLGSSHFSLSLWTTERNNVSPMHRANRFVWKIPKRIELVYMTQKF